MLDKPTEAAGGILDDLYTPEEIARRITASSGVHMTARTVWEKAKRLGLDKKIGRSMFVAAADIPALLVPETKKDRIERNQTIAGRAMVDEYLKHKRKLPKKPSQ